MKISNLIILGLLMVSVNSYTQEPGTAEIPDTIFLLGGKKLYVSFVTVNASKATYKEIGKTNIESIDRDQVQKVVWNDGRKEIFNKPVFEMVEEGDWKTVILTNDPSEVQGLTKKGNVESKSSSGSRNAKSAKRSAEIRLQKKAANLGASVVLITRKEAIGGYGEIPSYVMEGTAYGLDW